MNKNKIYIIIGLITVVIISVLINYNSYYNFNTNQCTKTECIYTYTENQREQLELIMYNWNSPQNDIYQGEYMNRYFYNSYCNIAHFQEDKVTIFQTPTCFQNPITISMDDKGLRSCWIFDRYEGLCFSGKDGIGYKPLKKNSEFDEIKKIFEQK
jgi:hypothetical protein